VRITDDPADVAEGWQEVAALLAGRTRRVLAVECYPGVHIHEIEAAFLTAAVVGTERALRLPDELERRLEPYLGDDPVFGFLCP
jgi:hypothetical protein